MTAAGPALAPSSAFASSAPTELPISQGGLRLPPLLSPRSETMASPTTTSTLSLGPRDHAASSGFSTAATSPGQEPTPGPSDSRNPNPSSSTDKAPSASGGVAAASESRDTPMVEGRIYRLETMQLGYVGAEVGFGLNTLGRLPIVPAYVFRLRGFEADGSEVPAEELPQSLVCSCALLPSDGDASSKTLDHVTRRLGTDPGATETRTALVGSLTSSLHRAPRPGPPPDGGEETFAYFVFSDVCVRVTGVFRLLFSVYDLRTASSSDEGGAVLAQAVSEQFGVVPFHQYPDGVEAVTELTRHLHRAGITVYAPPHQGISHLPP